MNDLYSTKVLHHSKLTPRLHQIIAQQPKNFVFNGGQYVKLFLEDATYKLYSIANAPNNSYLEFHIQEPSTHTLLKEFLIKLNQKSTFSISRPFGKCIVPNTLINPLLIIAGGCGFAHSKSIIEDIAMRPQVSNSVQLFWGVNELSDLYYLDDLNKLKSNKKWFNFEIILGNTLEPWHGRTGFVTDFAFNEYPNLKNHLLFVSGPPTMVETAYSKALKNKIKTTNFYSDYPISNKSAILA